MPAGDPPPAVEQEPERDLIKEAESDAALIRSAAAIRRHGGLPPPESDTLGVLVNGRTEALLAIDQLAPAPA